MFTELEAPRSGVLRATRRRRYRQSAEVVNLIPYGGVQYASHVAISREAKTRVRRARTGGKSRAARDMQIEEVGVGVWNAARTKDSSTRGRSVPLLYDYFTADRR